jgi:hypothetical protein
MNKKDIIKEELLPLKTINENFHVFELEDGSIVSAKVVLIHLIKGYTSNGGEAMRFQSHNVIGVWSPLDIRGDVGRSYTVKELEKYVDKKNLMFRLLKDGGINVYESDNIKIELNYRVKQIDKTSKYDEMGTPAYIIRSDNILTMSDIEKSE